MIKCAQETEVISVPKRVVNINIRESIQKIEAFINSQPECLGADPFPLKHSFAEGVYIRELFIPKGHLLVGKLHKDSYLNIIVKGDMTVLTESGVKRVFGAQHHVAPPGTKRFGYSNEDTVWLTVHPNPENITDIPTLERRIHIEEHCEVGVIPTSCKELEYFMEEAQRIDMEEIKGKEQNMSGIENNCLILALKEKGREYSFLLDLEEKGSLLPLKEAIKLLNENNIPLDGIYISDKVSSDGSLHANTESGIDIDMFPAGDNDLVGTAVATAIIGSAVIGAGTSYFSGRAANKAMDKQQALLDGLEYYEDPDYRETQDFLKKYGVDMLSGDIPDYYKSLGQSNSQEFQDLLKMTNRDITTATEEALAKGGRGRGGALAASTAQAIGDNTATMRYADLERAIQGKQYLMSQGTGITEGVRSAAQGEEAQQNNFNAMKTGALVDLEGSRGEAKVQEINQYGESLSGLVTGLAGMGSKTKLGKENGLLLSGDPELDASGRSVTGAIKKNKLSGSNSSDWWK